MERRIAFILLMLTGALMSSCQATTHRDPARTPAAPADSALAPSVALSHAEATDLMFALIGADAAQAPDALSRIVAARDERFVGVLIELLRAHGIGLWRGVSSGELIDALHSLSGQSFGWDWPGWVEWYGGAGLSVPPGFTGWKGQLLSGIDRRFGEFLRDEFPSRIRVEEIQWGGVRVDGIPALISARMIPAVEATYLEPGEPVFGVAINGDARAYPLRILDWHEMANDVVGGVPVSLAYCTLCGAGIAYDGRASDGHTYTFGSSGFLFRSNKLMYDHQTRTLWNQLTGEPVLGPLAATCVKLDLLPIVLTTWDEWKTQHPDTRVLDVNTGYQRPYVVGAAYGDYFSAPDTMFPVWQRGQGLPPKARVYALNINDSPKAYPVDVLAKRRVVNDEVGNTPVVLLATRGTVTVEGLSRRIGPVTYDAGGEVRAYDRGERTFAPGLDADTVIDAEGHTWQIAEEALISPEGEIAPRINGHLAYWFGWYAFFPQTLLYEP
jgi:hypothetical protein